MAYCPACRTEYRNDVERCVDCGTRLVEELPDEPELVWDSREWTTVEETGEPTTAIIIEGFLLESGLAVRVLNLHDRELPTTIGGLSTLEVQVPADQLDRALELLEERDRADPASTPDGRHDAPPEPTAGT